MNSFYKNAGGRIRRLRECCQMSREKFAEIADISPKFLYEIETGQKGFSAKTLQRIAKGLDVNCDYILTGKVHTAGTEELFQAFGQFDSKQKQSLLKLVCAICELNHNV